MNEIYFDMTMDDRPIYGKNKYLLKRWTKHTIYFKKGQKVRSANIHEDLYDSTSVYLYDYITLTEEAYKNLVYIEDTIDTTPAEYGTEDGSKEWRHRKNTFKNSPNATVSNYELKKNRGASIAKRRDIYGPCSDYSPSNQTLIELNLEDSKPLIKNENVYYEIITGYPRNHYIHKRSLFSLYLLNSIDTKNIPTDDITLSKGGLYLRNRQTSNSTIGRNGLEDGSLPVQTTIVGNVNLISGNSAIN